MKNGFLKGCSGGPLFYEVGANCTKLFRVGYSGGENTTASIPLLEQIATVQHDIAVEFGLVTGLFVVDDEQPKLVVCSRVDPTRLACTMTYRGLLSLTDVPRTVQLQVPIELVQYDKRVGFVMYGFGTFMHYNPLGRRGRSTEMILSNEQAAEEMKYLKEDLQPSRMLLDFFDGLEYTIRLQCIAKRGGQEVLVVFDCSHTEVVGVTVRAFSQAELCLDYLDAMEEVVYQDSFSSRKVAAAITSNQITLVWEDKTTASYPTPMDLRHANSNQRQFICIASDTPQGLFVELLSKEATSALRVQHKAMLLPLSDQPVLRAVQLASKLLGEDRFRHASLLRELTRHKLLPDVSQSSIFKFFLQQRPQVLRSFVNEEERLKNLIAIALQCSQWCSSTRNKLFQEAKEPEPEPESQDYSEMEKRSARQQLGRVIEIQELLLRRIVTQHGVAPHATERVAVDAIVEEISSSIRTAKAVAAALPLWEQLTADKLKGLYEVFHRLRTNRNAHAYTSVPNILLIEWFVPTVPICSQCPPLSKMRPFLREASEFQLNYVMHRLQPLCQCTDKVACQLMRSIIYGENKQLHEGATTHQIFSRIAKSIDSQSYLPEEALLYLACWAFHQKNYTASLTFLRQPQVNWYVNWELVCTVYVACRQLKRLCCEVRHRLNSGSIKFKLSQWMLGDLREIARSRHSDWSPIVDYYWRSH